MANGKKDEQRPGREKEPKPQDQQGGFDDVEEASEESFPASDPPGWTGTTGAEDEDEEK